MRFEYLGRQEFDESIDIENLGNIYLVAVDVQLGVEFYLSITTSLGQTEVKQFGPVAVDFNVVLSTYYQFSYQRFEYSETKIIKIIDKFVNPPKFTITQVVEISKEQFNERLKNLKIGEL